MGRAGLLRLCAAVAAATSLGGAAHANASSDRPDQSCLARALAFAPGNMSQTFTPATSTITRFRAQLYFRRAWSGPVVGSVSMRPAVTTAYASAKARTLASATVNVAGQPGEAHWVEFAMTRPVAVAPELRSLPGAWYSVDVDLPVSYYPVSEPAVGWLTCNDYYDRGEPYRAYSPRDVAHIAASYVNGLQPGSVNPALAPAEPAAMERVPALALTFVTYGS